jgi:hypothetical protein
MRGPIPAPRSDAVDSASGGIRRSAVKTKHAAIVSAVIAVSTFSLASLSGCGEGTTKQGTLYSIQANRSLETHLPGNLQSVYDATLRAVQEDFGYTLEDSAIDAMEAIVKARTAMDKEVRVKMYKHSDHVTRVVVFVGPRGAETVSRELLSTIETHLASASTPSK